MARTVDTQTERETDSTKLWTTHWKYLHFRHYVCWLNWRKIMLNCANDAIVLYTKNFYSSPQTVLKCCVRCGKLIFFSVIYFHLLTYLFCIQYFVCARVRYTYGYDYCERVRAFRYFSYKTLEIWFGRFWKGEKRDRRSEKKKTTTKKQPRIVACTYERCKYINHIHRYWKLDFANVWRWCQWWWWCT